MEEYSLKKEDILSFPATEMEPENIILSERGQTQKEKYCMFSLICRIPNTEVTEVESRSMVKRLGDGRNREVIIKGYKPQLAPRSKSDRIFSLCDCVCVCRSVAQHGN